MTTALIVVTVLGLLAAAFGLGCAWAATRIEHRIQRIVSGRANLDREGR